ncbi:hypothetical protein MmazTMA_03800 [Methanosarcina mazei]|nr:hypothetical protein MmazTMA_03800 [Methanosarcina mazei]
MKYACEIPQATFLKAAYLTAIYLTATSFSLDINLKSQQSGTCLTEISVTEISVYIHIYFSPQFADQLPD